jgi:hypothetical protein
MRDAGEKLAPKGTHGSTGVDSRSLETSADEGAKVDGSGLAVIPKMIDLREMDVAISLVMEMHRDLSIQQVETVLNMYGPGLVWFGAFTVVLAQLGFLRGKCAEQVVARYEREW